MISFPFSFCGGGKSLSESQEILSGEPRKTRGWGDSVKVALKEVICTKDCGSSVEKKVQGIGLNIGGKLYERRYRI